MNKKIGGCLSIVRLFCFRFLVQIFHLVPNCFGDPSEETSILIDNLVYFTILFLAVFTMLLYQY